MPIEQRRNLVTAVPGPRSLELAARKRASVADGVATTLPAYIVAARGGVLVDADGNQLVDFGSGIAVTTVGNAAPAVVRRVQQAVEQFTHTCFMVTPYEGYVEVAEKLAELTPGDHPKKSALFNSGAEAVENAIKIARRATRRPAVLALEPGFHGRTLLALTLTSKAAPYKDGFGPFAPEVYRIPLPREGDGIRELHDFLKA
ncbi:MAG TPA: aminotransferase class III-fold pyridoxal phosphate-dependent enzyme, partial [Micropruina sp.]|nr:aminotransferase class III-fold pyridoxal phosphate-dependent enzyme [Micropruina sp.]